MLYALTSCTIKFILYQLSKARVIWDALKLAKLPFFFFPNGIKKKPQTCFSVAMEKWQWQKRYTTGVKRELRARDVCDNGKRWMREIHKIFIFHYASIVSVRSVGVLCVNFRYNRRPIKSHIKSHEICEFLSHTLPLLSFSLSLDHSHRDAPALS